MNQIAAFIRTVLLSRTPTILWLTRLTREYLCFTGMRLKATEYPQEHSSDDKHELVFCEQIEFVELLKHYFV